MEELQKYRIQEQLEWEMAWGKNSIKIYAISPTQPPVLAYTLWHHPPHIGLPLTTIRHTPVTNCPFHSHSLQPQLEHLLPLFIHHTHSSLKLHLPHTDLSCHQYLHSRLFPSFQLYSPIILLPRFALTPLKTHRPSHHLLLWPHPLTFSHYLFAPFCIDTPQDTSYVVKLWYGHTYIHKYILHILCFLSTLVKYPCSHKVKIY